MCPSCRSQLRISPQKAKTLFRESPVTPVVTRAVGFSSDGRHSHGSPAGHHLPHGHGLGSVVPLSLPIKGAQERHERRLLIQKAAAGGARRTARGGRGGGAGRCGDIHTSVHFLSGSNMYILNTWRKSNAERSCVCCCCVYQVITADVTILQPTAADPRPQTAAVAGSS